MKRRILFIDRDGTLIVEPSDTFQIDGLEQLDFQPGVIRNLYFIRKRLDFEFVMVTNQDGLGTPANPRENFELIQSKMLDVFEREGVSFDKIFIDSSFPEDNLPTRKPGTAMLTEFFSYDYDLSGSFVIGDRLTDVELAKNLGCKAILYNSESLLDEKPTLKPVCVLATTDWDEIAEFLFAKERRVVINRKTRETSVYIDLNIDGTGKVNVSTGLHFFDHMLEQIGKHSGMDLIIKVKGDLEVDEHHTIEDTGIALGEALLEALGNKRGMERYGFYLPMDESIAAIALDFGGRPWLIWDVDFKRERVGDVPTEMFMHFFKSLSDAAKMNLHIRAEGQNDHHLAEGIFKGFARSIKMAVKRDIFNFELPTTKGVL